MYVGGISREYIFAFPFPFFYSIATNSQSHEMYIFWLAGFRLVFNLGNMIFFPGGVGIFF